MSTTSGFANNGATPNMSMNTSISPNQSSTTGNMNSYNSPSNPGLVKGVLAPNMSMNPSASPYTNTITTNNTGGTSTKPAPNPSVLAQQQALNKLGAGLVEDGIAGPLTQAAIAKYGTGSSSSSTTKAPDDPSNKYNTSTGQLNPNYPGYINPNNAPVGSSLGTQIGNVANTGNQTANEKTTYQGLLGQSQAPSQAYIDATNQYQSAVQNLNTLQQNLAKYDQGIEAQGIPMAGITGQEANLSKSAASQLDAAQQAVTQAQQALSYANTQQGLQVQAGTAANNAAQTTAARATGAQENVLGAVAPVSQFGVLTNPVTGNPVNGQSATDAAIQGGTIQGLQSGAATQSSTTGNIASQQATTIAGYKSALQQGQNLQSQLSDLIQTFGLNPADLNAANQAIQKIALNTSDPHYQQLQNYVNDIANTYAQILTPPGGSSTDTSRGIATSMLNATASGTSLLDTMKSLDNAAQAKIAGVSTTGSSTEGSGSSTSGFGWNG